MRIIDADKFGIVPVCPHCKRTIEELYRISDDKGWFEGHLGYCYMCPHCKSILGFSDYSSS